MVNAKGAYLGQQIISGWENIKVITTCKSTTYSYIHSLLLLLPSCSSRPTFGQSVMSWFCPSEVNFLPHTHTHTHTHTRWLLFQYEPGDSFSSQRSGWPPLIKRQRRPMSGARDKNKWWVSWTFISCMKWSTALSSRHAAATGPLKLYQGQVHFQMAPQDEAALTQNWERVDQRHQGPWLVCH